MNATYFHHRRVDMARAQGGFGMIAAIVVLVMMSVLAAAVTRLTWTQQTSSAQDLMGARAFQAANAGAEWGMFQALQAGGVWNGAKCTGSKTLDLSGTLGFKVTVTCSTQATAYNEGQLWDESTSTLSDSRILIYTIDAVACNGTATAGPDNANSAGMNYVERRRQAAVSSVAPGL